MSHKSSHVELVMRFGQGKAARLRLAAVYLAPLFVLFSACSGESPTTLDAAAEPRAVRGPAPGVREAIPDHGHQGTSLEVRVLGNAFDAGSRVGFIFEGDVSGNVVTTSTQFVSSQELLIDVTIGPDAPTGLYDIRVTRSTGKRGHGLEDFLVVEGDPEGEIEAEEPSTPKVIPGATGRIAFVRRKWISGEGGKGDIWIMNADATDQRQLTNHSADDNGPSWSPDGSMIAFASDRDGNYDIYTMTARGLGLSRLTYDSADDIHPAWSPDGSKILFASNRDGDYEVYVMSANGSGQVNLTNEPTENDWDPAWSPDGTRIVFARQYLNCCGSPSGPGGDLYVMNADGTEAANLTDDAEYAERHPAWSPDGSSIVFETPYPSPVGGQEEVLATDWVCTSFVNIWLINPDGTARAPLVPGGQSCLPTWSADGTNIAFVTRWKDGSFAEEDGGISLIDRQGTRVARLTHGPDERAVLRQGPPTTVWYWFPASWDTEPTWSP